MRAADHPIVFGQPSAEEPAERRLGTAYWADQRRDPCRRTRQSGHSERAPIRSCLAARRDASPL